MSNEKGFTLAELMVALVIIGVLASVAVSKYSPFKVRAYDANAQASLNHVFKACKDYWTFNHSADACLLSTLSDPEYGYTPSDDIEIMIDSDVNNTEYDFVATAQHTSSSKVFVITNQGAVSQISFDTVTVEEEEEQQSNDQGCSKQTKKNLKKLWKKAKNKKIRKALKKLWRKIKKNC